MNVTNDADGAQITDTLDREELLVELVDDDGEAAGQCSVLEAHTAPGRLHRAYSVLLFDAEGRVLLQKRAAVKTRFASRWSNTCCGHPAPGEDLASSALRRLDAELGLGSEHVEGLKEAGAFTYRAADDASGRVEHEFDHVLLGNYVGGTPSPDPAEVSDYVWVRPSRLEAALTSAPHVYSPWLPDVLRTALSA